MSQTLNKALFLLHSKDPDSEAKLKELLNEVSNVPFQTTPGIY